MFHINEGPNFFHNQPIPGVNPKTNQIKLLRKELQRNTSTRLLLGDSFTNVALLPRHRVFKDFFFEKRLTL